MITRSFTPTVALVNVLFLVWGNAVFADEVEASTAPRSVLLSSMIPLSPIDEDALFDTTFGVRRGRGFQVMKPIEFNDRKLEFNLSGPIVKSKASRKKKFGLAFEVRF
jgi:hypothetical protein